jgi:hypothetical protein
MSLARTRLSEKDRRFIIGRSGGCCNKCKARIFIDNEFGEQARLGDDAHIWAYSPGGPRADVPGAPADPNDRQNIILLCKICHAEVDAQPQKFTPDVLTTMREDHYLWADERLGQHVVHKPRFHYILYLNLIRLDMYAVANSIAPPPIDLGAAQSFDDLGIGAGRLMSAYTQILNSEDMYAHQISPDSRIDDLQIGQYCFIDQVNFRTVAIGKRHPPEAAWKRGESLIYRDYGDWRLICLIDPRWITTSTGGVVLTSGRSPFCGVMRVNQIDGDARKVITSPLFLAQA